MMEKYEIQKLRELPIEKVAKEMGMKVEHHKALCPFHDDHHASLTFNKTKNSCRCYVCMRNSLGTIDLVMRYLGKDFRAACRWLAGEHQIQLEEDSSSGSSSGNSSSGDHSGKSSFDASRYARFFEHPWLNGAARRFLFEERKIDWRVVNWCRLTSWTDKKGINWLQIPYFDTDGRLIGIQNRNLDYRKAPTDLKGVAAENLPQISQISQILLRIGWTGLGWLLTNRPQISQILLRIGWSRMLPDSGFLTVQDAASITCRLLGD